MNTCRRNRIAPTNDRITDPEARNIRNQLSDAEKDLVSLNERIAAARAVLSELLDQHRELTAEVAEYQISLAPHKKLPPEVLVTIFQHCVTGKAVIPPMAYESPDPWLLCQVCSYWRRLALETPTLWNNLSVEIDYDYGRVSPLGMLDMARTYLSRSGVSTPLSITVSNTLSPRSRSYLEPEDPVRVLINPYIRRCCEIKLSLSRIAFLPLLRLTPDCAEVLEVLDLEFFDADHDDNLDCSWSNILAVFSSAPRLHSVTFRSAQSMFEGPELLQLASSKLTELQLIDTWIYPDVCHAMLRQCPNLINCALCVDTYVGFEDILPHLDNIFLSNLQQLKLEPSVETNLAPFLAPLVLPALQDLELTSSYDQSKAAFTALHSRSSFDLKRFTSGVHVDELASLLLNMPSLVEFTARSQRVLDGPTLDMISKGDLLPKLEIVNFASLPPKVALDIIRWRWCLDANLSMGINSSGVSISRLREAVVSTHCFDHPNQSVRARLFRYKQQGLQFSLSPPASGML